MATVAREIGQIFAQQINFRQAIKDRIEDYIMKTELAALDPAVIRQRQAEINRMRDGLNDLDKQIADIMEQKVAGVDDIAQRWIAGTGSILAQEVAAGGRVEAARIGAVNDLQVAALNANARLKEAREKGLSDERVAQIAANTRVLEDLAKEEAKGSAGMEQNFTTAVDEAQTFAGVDRFQLEAKLGDLWNREFKGKYEALDGNPLAQRTLVENFARMGDTFVKSIGSQTARDSIRDDLVTENMSTAEVALRGAGLPIDFLSQDRATAVMDQATKLGYTEPVARGALEQFSATGGGGTSARPPAGREISGADRATLLGLQTPEQVKDFEEQAAYNRYLVDTVGPRGEVSTITFDEFKKASETAGSKEAGYISSERRAAPAEVAQYGDRALVDLMLRRKGAQVELADVKNAFDTTGSKFPSYDAVQRKTLEAYSELYGGRGQQRLVNLAEFGRKTPVKIQDPVTGQEREVFLDAPELEVLFGGGITGRGGGGRATPEGESVRQSTIVTGLDQNFVGQSTGMPSSRGTVPMRTPPPRIVDEQEPPLVLDLTPRTPEERGMFGRLPEFGVPAEVVERRDVPSSVIRTPEFDTRGGEPQTFREAQAQLTAKPVDTGAARFKAAPVDAELLTAPAPKPPAPEVAKPLKDMTSFELEGELKKALMQADALRKKMDEADAEEAQSIGEQIKALQERVKEIIITDQGNEITKEDFDKLTPEQLVAKAAPKIKPTLSASSQRGNAELIAIAEGSTAASKAQKEASSGKTPDPTKFIKGASKLTEGQVATIKTLAQKPGSVKAGSLQRTLAQIIGVDENSPLVEKAKSLYIAFEQLA